MGRVGGVGRVTWELVVGRVTSCEDRVGCVGVDRRRLGAGLYADVGCLRVCAWVCVCVIWLIVGVVWWSRLCCDGVGADVWLVWEIL